MMNDDAFEIDSVKLDSMFRMYMYDLDVIR